MSRTSFRSDCFRHVLIMSVKCCKVHADEQPRDKKKKKVMFLSEEVGCSVSWTGEGELL